MEEWQEVGDNRESDAVKAIRNFNAACDTPKSLTYNAETACLNI